MDEALPELNASGIDNANDAFEVLGGSSKIKIQKGNKGLGNITNTAFQEFHARMKKDLIADGYYSHQTGKDRRKAEELIEKAWAKSPDNPKYQGVQVAYNATKEEIAQAKAEYIASKEARLGKA